MPPEPSDSPRPKAYSYVRFSTPEQQRGDSFRRQTEKAVDYAARKELDLDDTLNLHDLGKSAYRSANLTTGRLGDFLEAVIAGEVPRGSFLLVESLDRLSRANAFDAQITLSSIISRGITVVSLIDEREYSLEAVERDPMSTARIARRDASMFYYSLLMREHPGQPRGNGMLLQA